MLAARIDECMLTSLFEEDFDIAVDMARIINHVQKDCRGLVVVLVMIGNRVVRALVARARLIWCLNRN